VSNSKLVAGDDGGTDWRAVVAAVACGIAVAMNVGKVPITLTQLRGEFGLSLVMAGWVASMFNTLAVFAALFVGMACDRVGHLRMATIAICVSIAAGLGGLLAQGSGTLLLSRFFEGMGFLGVAVSAPGLISAASLPADRRFALGIWATYMPGGVGLAMVLAPLILPLGGWRALWLASICGLVLAALAIYRCRRAYGLPHASLPAHSLAVAREAVAQPAPWLLGFALCTWAIQHFALIVWLPTFLTEQRGLPPTAVGLLSALMVIANVPGNLVGGVLIQRHLGRGKLIMAASLVTGLLSLAVYLELLPDLPRYLCCVLLSFCGGLIPASVLSASAALATSPRQIGTLQGLFMQCANLGQFVGPPLIAALVASSGLWRDALWVTGTAAVAGIFLGLAIYGIERKKVSHA
jgi:CP family cyanate transporter-like MFS transporter